MYDDEHAVQPDAAKSMEKDDAVILLTCFVVVAKTGRGTTLCV